jgi:hypothetical protein
MELLYILTTVYFQFEDKFYQQKEGMAMGNLLSSVVSIISSEHFEELALDTVDHKPAKWLRHADDIFMVSPHGQAKLQQFLQRRKSFRPTIRKLKLMIPFRSWTSWP